MASAISLWMLTIFFLLLSLPYWMIYSAPYCPLIGKRQFRRGHPSRQPSGLLDCLYTVEMAAQVEIDGISLFRNLHLGPPGKYFLGPELRRIKSGSSSFPFESTVISIPNSKLPFGYISLGLLSIPSLVYQWEQLIPFV